MSALQNTANNHMVGQCMWQMSLVFSAVHAVTFAFAFAFAFAAVPNSAKDAGRGVEVLYTTEMLNEQALAAIKIKRLHMEALGVYGPSCYSPR